MNLQNYCYVRGFAYPVLAAGQFGKLLSEVCEGHNGALHDILPVPRTACQMSQSTNIVTCRYMLHGAEMTVLH